MMKEQTSKHPSSPLIRFAFAKANQNGGGTPLVKRRCLLEALRLNRGEYWDLFRFLLKRQTGIRRIPGGNRAAEIRLENLRRAQNG